MLRRVALITAFSLVLPPLVAATSEEAVDWTAMTQIRDEGLNRSKVMETLQHLTDVLGPRLTGSPNLKAANEWTRKQLEDWGLVNAHLEAWGPFGRGWSYSQVAVRMLAPTESPLVAYPKAWTPGTDGPQRGKVVKAKLEKDEDLEPLKGKLEGAIVFLDDARELAPPEKPYFTRDTDEDLAQIAEFAIPGARRDGDGPPRRPNREEVIRRIRFQKTLREFLKSEKALASVEVSGRDGGIVRVGGGGSREPGEDPGVLGLVMAAEHYNRLVRMLDDKLDVELEIDVKAGFHDDDTMAYNTIAEIPGTDKKAEIVMVGAHLDSWHAGTGATDNAAGSAVAMEALRILKALDLKPRRTIRIGLWAGEEQGLLGSRAYVKEHFATRPDPKPEDAELPSFLRRDTGPLTLKPEHARFAAYFNLDNGTGKIRGVYAQQNAAAKPIFEAWLEPFHDLGAKTVTLRNTGGTDHLSFDAVGLPGFQFIQDPGDYTTRTHHTHMDVYDRIQREDMMQASVIMAAFVYNAAMRDELFPRKPLPKEAVAAPAPAAKDAKKKPAKK
jgi:carboxypeptidase Q